MKQLERELKKKKGNEATYDLQIKHILPKANDIVKTADQNIKCIYPFDLIAAAPSKHFETPFKQVTYTSTIKKHQKTKLILNKNSITEYFVPENIVYDKFNLYNNNFSYSTNIYNIDRLKNLSKNDFIINIEKTNPGYSSVNNIQFDSRFQSGNLSAVAYDSNLYALLLHNDVNTTGYTNWFYFSMASKSQCRTNIAIMNYGKAGWPLNFYPGICVWVQGQNMWKRHSLNLQCDSNKNMFFKPGEYENFNTLYFQYDFKQNQKVFFAYTPPYTYTNLLQLLDSIQEKKYVYFHRKLAGTSLIGNRIELITITNFQKLKKQPEYSSPVIVILARSHAGQTVSSWIIHHLITYLVSNQDEAKLLRDSFVFKIFPMINPDGVIHGNYRCSLIGRDLNRRWKNPAKEYYPQIYYIKNQIIDTFQKRPIKMVIDLHGHTQKKKAFFYACGDKNNPHKSRLFPYLASKLNEHFDFSSCNFAIQKSKESTARITLFNLIKSPDIFTVETSQFGMADKFLSTEGLNSLALTLCIAIAKYFKINKNITIDAKTQIDQCEEQILSSPLLMKVGCDPSDGSDSQPSVCNMHFQKINKMTVNMNKRPVSQSFSIRKKLIERPQSYIKTNYNNMPNRLFSTNKSRDINQNPIMSPSLLVKCETTSLYQEKKSQKQKDKLDKRQTKEVKSSYKLRMIGHDIQKKPVKMINFELLINESGRRKSSLKQQNFKDIDIKFHHVNYHMFQKKNIFKNISYNWNQNNKNSV